MKDFERGKGNELAVPGRRDFLSGAHHWWPLSASCHGRLERHGRPRARLRR